MSTASVNSSSPTESKHIWRVATTNSARPWLSASSILGLSANSHFAENLFFGAISILPLGRFPDPSASQFLSFSTRIPIYLFRRRPRSSHRRGRQPLFLPAGVVSTSRLVAEQKNSVSRPQNR